MESVTETTTALSGMFGPDTKLPRPKPVVQSQLTMVLAAVVTQFVSTKPCAVTAVSKAPVKAVGTGTLMTKLPVPVDTT